MYRRGLRKPKGTKYVLVINFPQIEKGGRRKRRKRKGSKTPAYSSKFHPIRLLLPVLTIHICLLSLPLSLPGSLLFSFKSPLTACRKPSLPSTSISLWQVPLCPCVTLNLTCQGRPPNPSHHCLGIVFILYSTMKTEPQTQQHLSA